MGEGGGGGESASKRRMERERQRSRREGGISDVEMDMALERLDTRLRKGLRALRSETSNARGASGATAGKRRKDKSASSPRGEGEMPATGGTDGSARSVVAPAKADGAEGEERDR